MTLVESGAFSGFLIRLKVEVVVVLASGSGPAVPLLHRYKAEPP
jgi:hypothetical protein